MTRSIGQRLPHPVAELLDGDRLEQKVGAAFECLTLTEAGWPYVAMVSVGELLASDPSSLRLAIWSGSTTARNLERQGRCVLSLVHRGVSYQVRCDAIGVGALAGHGGPDLTAFDLSIVEMLEDQAPYATLTSGITYQLHDPGAVVERWQRTIQALRDLG
jgi:hypothetical protein